MIAGTTNSSPARAGAARSASSTGSDGSATSGRSRRSSGTAWVIAGTSVGIDRREPREMLEHRRELARDLIELDRLEVQPGEER